MKRKNTHRIICTFIFIVMCFFIAPSCDACSDRSTDDLIDAQNFTDNRVRESRIQMEMEKGNLSREEAIAKITEDHWADREYVNYNMYLRKGYSPEQAERYGKITTYAERYEMSYEEAEKALGYEPEIVETTEFDPDYYLEGWGKDETDTSEGGLPELTVEAYLLYLDGWWKSEDGSKTNNFIVWFESLESQGMIVTYSIDKDSQSLKVLITSNNEEVTIEENYGFVFTFIDVNHVSVTGTGEKEKATLVYERCDAPE